MDGIPGKQAILPDPNCSDNLIGWDADDFNKFDSVFLTHDEASKFFFHARYRAVQALIMAVKLKEVGGLDILFRKEALRWLETAKDIFPLVRDGDSISIEDIINGKEPEHANPMGT